jgi:hypothetical protein
VTSGNMPVVHKDREMYALRVTTLSFTTAAAGGGKVNNVSNNHVMCQARGAQGAACCMLTSRHPDM